MRKAYDMDCQGAKKEIPQRRKYRLNKKKLIILLFLFSCFAALIVVTAEALMYTSVDADENVDVDAVSVITSQIVTSQIPVNTQNAMPQGTSQIKKTPAVGGQNGQLVVLDAGHGGFDPGTIGVNGSHEDKLNLAITKYLKTEFENRDMDVIMTRSND